MIFRFSRVAQKVVETIPPLDSSIQKLLPGSYFYDSYSVVSKHPTKSTLHQFLIAMKESPSYMDHLMSLRNFVANCVGLKNLGAFTNVDITKDIYQIGDRAGVFALLEQSDNEVWIGDKDKHLDEVISIYRHEEPSIGDPTTNDVVITVTTVVHVNNWMGRLYMLPATPMHKMFMPKILDVIDKYK